jgi:hypothetical protein
MLREMKYFQKKFVYKKKLSLYLSRDFMNFRLVSPNDFINLKNFCI